jgi:peptidoglycan/LPS O-acetylase OafA/YrhL
MTWNMPSWSISAEFYTYALFGLLVLTLKKSKTTLNLLSVMLVLGAGITLNRVGMGSDNISGPLRCIYSFFIGVITHSFFDSFQLRGKLFNSYPAVFVLALSIIAIICLGDQYKGWVTWVPILFSITIATIVSTQPSTFVIEKLSNSKLVYLGTISYGLYMIHAAVWWVINQTLLFALKFPTTFNEQGEKVLKVQNAYLADSILLIGMAATLILAHFSWTRLEKRFSTFGNKALSPFGTTKECVEKPS